MTTLAADGQGQNSRAHPDSWIAASPGSLTFAEHGNEVRASARYDLGYGPDNAIKVIHHREVVFVEQNYWILFDTITGDGMHGIESRFQFGPGDLVVKGRQVTTQFEDANLLVAFTGEWNVRILKGEENPRAGWYSAGYNKIEPAPTLSLTQEIDLPLRYTVLLFPFQGTQTPETTFSLENQTATVSFNGNIHTISASG